MFGNIRILNQRQLLGEASHFGIHFGLFAWDPVGGTHDGSYGVFRTMYLIYLPKWYIFIYIYGGACLYIVFLQWSWKKGEIYKILSRVHFRENKKRTMNIYQNMPSATLCFKGAVSSRSEHRIIVPSLRWSVTAKYCLVYAAAAMWP